jgi:hypothetical protein
MAAALLGYWALFFTIGLAPDPLPDGYLAFERAFPVADALLSAALVGGAVLGRRRHRWAERIQVAAGGALLFLGLVDVTFNLQNGIYAGSLADGAFNAFVNLVTLGMACACLLTPP